MKDNKANIVWTYAKKHYHGRWKYVAVLLVLLPFSPFLLQLISWYFAQAITLITDTANRAEVWQEIKKLCVLVLVLMIIVRPLGYFNMMFMQKKLLIPLGISIRQDLFDKTLPRDSRFWSRNTAGSVWGRIETIRRCLAAQSMIGTILFEGYIPMCMWLVVIGFIFKINTGLGLYCVVAFFALTFCFYKISANVKRASAQQEIFVHKTNGKIVNMIQNHFLLKIFGSLKREKDKLSKNLDTVIKSMKKNRGIRFKNQAVHEAFSLLFTMSVIIYAITLWVKQIITVGDVVYILTSVTSLANNLGMMMDVIQFVRSQYYKVKSALNLLDVEPNKKVREQKLNVNKGEIEIKNLHYAYRDGQTAIKNVSLKIRAGEKIGVVGMSGGGKTTLLHLLQRFIEPPKGTIFIDNQDISAVKEESLHQAIAFIPQDTSLFHRSIGENIHYGDIKAPKKEVKAAAQKAYADKFIEDFPKGYETKVGDKGVKLSGGQRQRIGIARAILKNAPILLLDEATSALDSESEFYIQKSLEKLIKKKTVIAVAHRLSTLRNMDRIIVMEKGEIIEEGTPDELLKNQGKYATLWNLQS